MKLHHPLNRKFQRESYNRLVTAIKSGAPNIVLRLATGIGKSAIALSLGCDEHYDGEPIKINGKTLVLVDTNSYQQQYANTYDIETIYGKSHYSCNGYGQSFEFIKPTADLCNCPKQYKDICNNSCEYPLQRESFVNSYLGVTSYAKFKTDMPIIVSTEYTTGFDPEFLVLDEAHTLHDQVIDFSGSMFRWSDKFLQRYTMPIEIDIARIAQEKAIPETFATQVAMEMAREWLQGLQWSLKKNRPLPPSKGGDIKLYKWYRRKLDKVDILLHAIDSDLNAWFVHADDYGLLIKPKTAKFHFNSLFNKADTLILMSATISRKDMAGLGIEDYVFIDMPNPIPKEDRPINVLDTPTITWQSSAQDIKQHQTMIANVINAKPDDWLTLVQFPSYSKCEDWADVIYKQTGRPVFVPERKIGTLAAYEAWQEFKQAGAVCVSPIFGVGFDMGDINLNVLGDVPFPVVAKEPKTLDDMYSKARTEYDWSMAYQQTAATYEQWNGRNRRGFDDHYGPFAKKSNVVCASKKLKMIRKYLSRDFIEAMV